MNAPRWVGCFLAAMVALAPHFSRAAPPVDAPAPEELKSSEAVGGRVYRTHIDAGGANIALWRYAASGDKSGPPIFIVPELFCSRVWYDEFALALQRRGREVFLFEWRGSGQSGAPAAGFGDLASLFLGDAPAAFDAALEASGAKSMELLGHGLGGAAAVMLAASARGEHISSLVLISVPANYAVPNLALRNLIAAVRALPAPPAQVSAASYASMDAPLGNPDRPGRWTEAQAPLDLFALLLAHGTVLSPARTAQLRENLGGGTPALFADLATWMEAGELRLGEGPRAPKQTLGNAWALMAQPALLVASPLDNLVHLEHALALRGDRSRVRDELILQRIEGFPEDAGHLAIQSPWGPRVLAPRILDWLAEHP